MEISICQDNSLVILTFSGVYDVDYAFKYIQDNIDSWGKKQILLDLTDLDYAGLTHEEIRRMVYLYKKTDPYRKGLKTAIVGPGDLQLGLIRTFGSLSEIHGRDIDEREFRTIDEAKKWLLNE